MKFFLLDIVLEKHWVGPLVHLWDKKQCQPLDTITSNTTHACKLACEKKESCNAISVQEIPNGGSFCQLNNCSSPVPAPNKWPDNKTLRYLQTTGKMIWTDIECSNRVYHNIFF